MTTIVIRNAQTVEQTTIQSIINKYGFLALAEENGVLYAVKPDPITGPQVANCDRDLLNNVGKHLGITYE